MLCGILGRMGGAGGKFRSWMRDYPIPLIICLLLGFFYGWHWTLVAVYLLTVVSLSTYWDFLFKFDNLWFSGFMLGFSLTPYLIQTGNWVWFYKPFLLAIIWGSLNKFLPQKLFIWRRDVAEEFLRYATLLIGITI